MAKMIPTEQKLVDMTDGHVVALTRVKAAGVNNNWVTLPSAAIDAHIMYGVGQTALGTAGFYTGQSVRGAGIGPSFTSNVANIDGTTAGTEFLIASRHANIKNSG